MVFVPDRENGPEDHDHDSQWKPGCGHERVKEENVHNDWREKHQRQRNEAVQQQKQAADNLDPENDYVVVGSEYGPKELCGDAGWGRHVDELKKSIQAEDDEYQTQKQP
jgi:hypothetical protein